MQNTLHLLLVDFPLAYEIHTEETSVSWSMFAASDLESVSGHGLGGLASLPSMTRKCAVGPRVDRRTCKSENIAATASCKS